MTRLRVSVLQMCSSNTHAVNIATLRAAAKKAREEDHADMLVLPEAAGLMERDKEKAVPQVTRESACPFVHACKEVAAEHNLWLQACMPVLPDGGGGDEDARFLNHSLLINDKGEIVDRYSKSACLRMSHGRQLNDCACMYECACKDENILTIGIIIMRAVSISFSLCMYVYVYESYRSVHLFDVFVDGMPPTGESNRYRPGFESVVASSPWGNIGLSICYDLRFPHLYREYAKNKAAILMIPSAFTVKTGLAHWEVLLRARAIENGAFVIAAAQVGSHADGRTTYGHSLVVNPWGEVVLDLGGDETAQQTIELDLDEVDAARRQIPSLQNEREYEKRVCA